MKYRIKNFQPLRAIPFSMVLIDDCFWNPRLENNRKISLFSQYERLVQSGVLDNFKMAETKAKTSGDFQGLFFADSDLYKWLEAASLSITTHPDSRLEALVDEAIGLIAAAQEENGYINTYFQLVEPEKKYTNFGVCHELYTAGHLLQAAVAHFKASGKKSLLNIAVRLADHLVEIFGPGKLEAVDGHAGIETALVSLYRATGVDRYLELARFFINRRGAPDSRLRWELAHLDEIAGKSGKPGQNNLKHYGTSERYDGRYTQDHLPVREQSEVVGHAVRAMYLYCGMADLAAETGDPALKAALERLWRHLTSRRMYITGGIGPARANEGFTRDFDLPNDTTCAESCAAVGMVMWNHRMLHLTGESRFADLMERVLYNAFLVGVSLDGRKYSYNNPLQSFGEWRREEWYECACCPPNMARLLASLGGYIYSQTAKGLAVHLYIQSEVKIHSPAGAEIRLQQETDYPWEGKIRFSVEVERPVRFEIGLRIPGWCRAHTIMINRETVNVSNRKGYAVIKRLWSSKDSLELNLEMPVERMEAHPAVWENSGRVALQRGPLIYCLEEVDHPAPVGQIVLPENSNLISRFDDRLLGGVVVIEGEALTPALTGWENTLYRKKTKASGLKKVPLHAIPYYCWGNRDSGAMAVWIREE